MTHTFTIPKRAVSWNTMYAGKHWASRHKMAKDWHTETMVAVRKAKIPKLTGRYHITVTAYAVRPLDADNICAKVIIDGLKGLVLPDDTAKYIRAVTLIPVKAQEDWVEVTISE